MITVVGVRFKKAGKVYYFDPGKLKLTKGENVILETARGVEMGEVVVGPKEITEKEVVAPLKEVIRIATSGDLQVNEGNKEKEAKAFDICLKKIEEHKLEMKLVDVEYTFDNNKIIFYFTAEGRVDFRDLVKDLAGVFKTRIELRQIGVRDEAKMIGGIGPCGVSLCCSTWLGEFDPVSIKMAKDQNLSLNPTKISGVCGRLFCCLKYEHDVYKEMLKKLPHVGDSVKTPYGRGPVIQINPLLERVKVKVTNDNDGTEEIKVFQREEVEKLGAFLKREKERKEKEAEALSSGEEIRDPDEIRELEQLEELEKIEKQGKKPEPSKRREQRPRKKDGRPEEKRHVEKPQPRRKEDEKPPRPKEQQPKEQQPREQKPKEQQPREQKPQNNRIKKTVQRARERKNPIIKRNDGVSPAQNPIKRIRGIREGEINETELGNEENRRRSSDHCSGFRLPMGF